MRIILVIAGLLSLTCSFCQTYAIMADKLIDCKTEKAIDNPTIIVSKNRITDINYNHSVPEGAVLINLKGYTVLPGLMDVHTHVLAAGLEDYEKDLYDNSPSFRSLRAVAHLSAALQNGFTTLRDVCTEGAGFADVDIKRAIDSGFIAGPRLFPSGKGIAATGQYVPAPKNQNWELSLPSGTQYASGSDECIKAVREQVARGVSWIKLYSDWRTPTFNFSEINAIVEEAKRNNIPVAAHATTKEGIRMAILAGVKSIEHGTAFDDSLIQLAIKNQVYWCPTSTVMEYYNGSKLQDNYYRFLNKAYQSKLKIVCGTDIGSFPWTIDEAKELEYYVKKAGLTPMDAIKTATVNAAELLGIGDRLGLIEKGFIADIIAVKGNPLDDIVHLQQVAFVMKEGKIYKQPAGK